ncbi:hypothetical protein QEN19_001412 [Hanseniaspora menglaensis]
MVQSAKEKPPVFFKNGPLFPTVHQIQDRLSPICTFLPMDKSFSVISVPVYSASEISNGLLEVMYNNFNEEIINGHTYPQYEPYDSIEDFKNYWFHSFTCILLKKDNSYTEVTDFIKREDITNWEDFYLGSFYIKPNYVGRCSHVCNAGFFIPSKYRGLKISYRLGQLYLQYAPKLGYSQSIYNLVYVNNIGSWKTWEKLKFKRIGTIPNVAVAGKSQVAVSSSGYAQYEYEYTDAYIYSKNLLEIEDDIFNDM